MKRIITALVLALVAILLLTSSGFSEQSNRLALVIGNGACKSSPLKNPTNDAYDIARTLKKLGFEVIHKENVGQRVMEKAIRDFGSRLRKGGVGLFYFAGHGMQVNGRNYLIPIGAKIYEETDMKYEAIDAGQILDAMYNAGNSLNIVILDACRDNPFARSFRTSARGLARMDAPTGTLISYSTAPGMIAADGEGRNAVYTKYLLKYITTPGLTVEQVLKKVRVEVINETGNKQVPWESSSLTGDFYFASKRAIAIKRPDTTELEKERQRLEFERQELERLKMEIERKKLEMVKLPPEPKYTPPVSKPGEVARDGTFIAYATGVVKDTKTGLEWVAGPDRDVSWDEANSWAESLSVDGGGWRMPTRTELRALFKKRVGKYNMISLLKTTGSTLWSGETRFEFYDIRAYRLNFIGGDDWWTSINSSTARAFAVRRRLEQSQPQYCLTAYGAIYDSRTGLEWYVGPDKGTTWHDAEDWVRRLAVDGFGWRMPTRTELKVLYKKGLGTRNMDPAFLTTGWWVWSGETHDYGHAWYFQFYRGSEGYGDSSFSKNGRAFAVRP